MDTSCSQAVQGLSDARYLYHGTGIYCLAAIVASNRLEEGVYWGKPGEPHGPRTSLDAAVARSFIPYNFCCEIGGILALDARALARDYELVAYTDTFYSGGTIGDEQEICIVTSEIEPLHRYLLRIECPAAAIREARDPELMELAFDEGGWPFSAEDDRVLTPKAISYARHSLDALESHPRLNPPEPEL